MCSAYTQLYVVDLTMQARPTICYQALPHWWSTTLQCESSVFSMSRVNNKNTSNINNVSKWFKLLQANLEIVQFREEHVKEKNQAENL